MKQKFLREAIPLNTARSHHTMDCPAAAVATAAAAAEGVSSAPHAPRFERLVLDANSIIASGSSGLAGSLAADAYYSVQEALLEVRDAKARAVLEALPFPIETRLPSDASISAVREFARKTGDIARLSRTDLLLLALAYQLEREVNGGTFIRTEPLSYANRSGLPGGSKPISICKFFGTPDGCRNGQTCRFRHDAAAAAAGAGASSAASTQASSAAPVAPLPSESSGTNSAIASTASASPSASSTTSSLTGDATATSAAAGTTCCVDASPPAAATTTAVDRGSAAAVASPVTATAADAHPKPAVMSAVWSGHCGLHGSRKTVR